MPTRLQTRHPVLQRGGASRYGHVRPADAIDEFIEVLDKHPDVDIVIGSRVKLLDSVLTGTTTVITRVAYLLPRRHWHSVSACTTHSAAQKSFAPIARSGGCRDMQPAEYFPRPRFLSETTKEYPFDTAIGCESLCGDFGMGLAISLARITASHGAEDCLVLYGLPIS